MLTTMAVWFVIAALVSKGKYQIVSIVAVIEMLVSMLGDNAIVLLFEHDPAIALGQISLQTFAFGWIYLLVGGRCGYRIAGYCLVALACHLALAVDFYINGDTTEFRGGLYDQILFILCLLQMMVVGGGIYTTFIGFYKRASRFILSWSNRIPDGGPRNRSLHRKRVIS